MQNKKTYELLKERYHGYEINICLLRFFSCINEDMNFIGVVHRKLVTFVYSYITDYKILKIEITLVINYWK